MIGFNCKLFVYVDKRL